MGLIKNVHLIYLDGCIFKPVSVLLTYISRAFLPLPWLRQPWQSHKAHCTVIGDGVKISVKLFFYRKYSFAPECAVELYFLFFFTFTMAAATVAKS